MGLAERRIVKSFQESNIIEIKNEIEKVIGYSVEIDVDWDSLAEDEMSHMYEEAWNKVYFKPLQDALASICSDEMGKEALKDGLEKIIVKNTDDVSSASYWSTFSDGRLTLNHKPTSNIDYAEDRSKALLKTLENNL